MLQCCRPNTDVTADLILRIDLYFEEVKYKESQSDSSYSVGEMLQRMKSLKHLNGEIGKMWQGKVWGVVHCYLCKLCSSPRAVRDLQ